MKLLRPLLPPDSSEKVGSLLKLALPEYWHQLPVPTLRMPAREMPAEAYANEFHHRYTKKAPQTAEAVRQGAALQPHIPVAPAGADFYRSDPKRVEIAGSRPAMLAHEMGHAADDAKGTLFSDAQGTTVRGNVLADEAAATSHALSLPAIHKNPASVTELLAAFSTYGVQQNAVDGSRIDTRYGPPALDPFDPQHAHAARHDRAYDAAKARVMPDAVEAERANHNALRDIDAQIAQIRTGDHDDPWEVEMELSAKRSAVANEGHALRLKASEHPTLARITAHRRATGPAPVPLNPFVGPLAEHLPLSQKQHLLKRIDQSHALAAEHFGVEHADTYKATMLAALEKPRPWRFSDWAQRFEKPLLQGASKLGSITLLTGSVGSGKSTLAAKLKPHYDLVVGTDTGFVQDGKYVQRPKEEREQIRSERTQQILNADAAGKRVLVEGFPAGHLRYPGVVEEADRVLVLDTGKLKSLFSVGKRSFQRGTPLLPDLKMGLQTLKEDAEELKKIVNVVGADKVQRIDRSYKESGSKTADIKTPLLPHQQRVVDKIQRPDQPGLVVAHALGSGKTLTALAAQDSLGMNATAVMPAALRANYRKEMAKHQEGVSPTTDIESLQGAALAGETTPNPLLLVDEAHRVREPSTKAYKALAANDATKRLLMTATPFYNHPADIAPLINLASGQRVMPTQRGEFEKKYVRDRMVSPGFLKSLRGVRPGVVTELNPMSKRELAAHLAKWVDYYPGSKKGYPTTTDENIEVPMDAEQLKVYDTMMDKAPYWVSAKVKAGLPPSKAESKQLNAFLGAVRQVSNTTGGFGGRTVHSPKIQRAYEELEKEMASNPEARAVIYSNFLESGVHPYRQLLQAHHVPFGEFTGEQKPTDRDQMVRDYNEGKLKALLLSSAGGEGLDLKRTSLMQLLEPHWNETRGDQVIGRGVRYMSHDGMPEEMQKVRIQHFLATRPRSGMMERAHLKDPGMGVDQYLTQMSADKTRLNDQFKALLEEQNRKEMAEAAAKEQPGLKAAGLNIRTVQRAFGGELAAEGTTAADALRTALGGNASDHYGLLSKIREMRDKVERPPVFRSSVRRVEYEPEGTYVSGRARKTNMGTFEVGADGQKTYVPSTAPTPNDRLQAILAHRGADPQVVARARRQEEAFLPAWERTHMSGNHHPVVQVPTTVSQTGERLPHPALNPATTAYKGTEARPLEQRATASDSTPIWLSAHPDVAKGYALPGNTAAGALNASPTTINPGVLEAFSTAKLPTAGPWSHHVAVDTRSLSPSEVAALPGRPQSSGWSASPTYERVVSHADLEPARTHKYKVFPSGNAILTHGDVKTSPLHAPASLKEASAAKLLRPRVTVLIHNDKNEVLAEHHPENGGYYQLPGGGIETGQSVQSAARREALEEVGYDVGKLRSVLPPTTLIWPAEMKKGFSAKRSKYDGSKDYWFAAPVGERNKSLYGSEGDALAAAKFHPIDTVLAHTRKQEGKSEESLLIDQGKSKALEELRKLLTKK